MSDPALPKALFIAPDGRLYPDNLICSGALPAEFGGRPCPYSDHGRCPDPAPLRVDDPAYSPDKGQPGDLCPPCVKQQLAHFGHWQGHRSQSYPDELLALRLFKCRQWFWLVVPGLYHAEPGRLIISGNGHGPAASTSLP